MGLCVWLGFAGKAQTFRAFEYSYSVAIPMDSTNQEPLYPWHPRIPNMVYYGMDWLCPGMSQPLLLHRIRIAKSSS